MRQELYSGIRLPLIQIQGHCRDFLVGACASSFTLIKSAPVTKLVVEGSNVDPVKYMSISAQLCD